MSIELNVIYPNFAANKKTKNNENKKDKKIICVCGINNKYHNLLFICLKKLFFYS